ncbi:alginate lyase family protein [Glycomyces buryatensis]|nr:alginate lyase family protein [Glycomyces buryatensis]
MSKHRASSAVPAPRRLKDRLLGDRRRFLQGVAIGGGLAAVGVAGYWFTRDTETSSTTPEAAPETTAGASASPSPTPTPGGAGAGDNARVDGVEFERGMLHTAADFERMAEKVEAGESPWIDGWNRLTANGRSAADWSPRPLETVVRGGDGDNVGQMFTDIHAAYQNGLRWKISGDEAHATAAVDILNAWSASLKEITGNADRFLAAGIQGYQAANAAELVRDIDGFELERFQTMLTDVFYPLNDHFLNDHNDACVTNYWSNWDLCNLNSVLAIGIFNEDEGLVGRALDYYENGEGNGALKNAVPFVYDDEGLAQQQESGRDQGHSLMATGLLGSLCEMAWNQGVDLYGMDDNRLAKCAEYVARYNLGQDVPYTEYIWYNGQDCRYNEQTQISAAQRGQVRPMWALLYHHYAGRQGLSMPNVADIMAQNGPEGGGGDYGFGSGGFDHLGFGTLTHAR